MVVKGWRDGKGLQTLTKLGRLTPASPSAAQECCCLLSAELYRTRTRNLKTASAWRTNHRRPRERALISEAHQKATQMASEMHNMQPPHFLGAQIHILQHMTEDQELEF